MLEHSAKIIAFMKKTKCFKTFWDYLSIRNDSPASAVMPRNTDLRML